MAPPPPPPPPLSSSDYTSTPSTGKLKLKGVKDAKVDKKKKKKLRRHSKSEPRLEGGDDDGGGDDEVPKNDNEDEDAGLESDFNDSSVVLKSLADEDAALTKEKRRRPRMEVVDRTEVGPGAAGVGHDGEDAELGERIKTEAEKRYDEQRRKRVSFPFSILTCHFSLVTSQCPIASQDSTTCPHEWPFHGC